MCETYIHDQMYLYFDSVVSKKQCGLPQGCITQTFLLVKIKKWKQSFDNHG